MTKHSWHVCTGNWDGCCKCVVRFGYSTSNSKQNKKLQQKNVRDLSWKRSGKKIQVFLMSTVKLRYSIFLSVHFSTAGSVVPDLFPDPERQQVIDHWFPCPFSPCGFPDLPSLWGKSICVDWRTSPPRSDITWRNRIYTLSFRGRDTHLCNLLNRTVRRWINTTFLGQQLPEREDRGGWEGIREKP